MIDSMPVIASGSLVCLIVCIPPVKPNANAANAEMEIINCCWILWSMIMSIMVRVAAKPMTPKNMHIKDRISCRIPAISK